MQRGIAVVRGCCQTYAAQIGIRFRFRRQTQPLPAFFYEHRFPLFCRTSLPPGRERRACCGYLNQARGLSPPPRGKTTTPNYSLKHARPGSDRVTASTSPLISATSPLGPLRSYLCVIFMRFRGPAGPKGQSRKNYTTSSVRRGPQTSKRSSLASSSVAFQSLRITEHAIDSRTARLSQAHYLQNVR